MTELINAIKKAAEEAVAAKKPMETLIGTVTSTEPLRVRLTSGIELTSAFLRLTDNVISKTYKSISISITIPGLTAEDETEESTTYSATADDDAIYSATINSLTLDNSLEKNDKVILLREQGGQSYIVLNKVVG